MNTSRLPDSGERKEFKSGGLKDPSGRISKGRFDLIPPTGLRRLAKHYGRGTEKYPDRNWEKGIPFSVCCDSLLRHINQYREGDRAEDHLAACSFWSFAMMHFEETGRTDLMDLPEYAVDENIQWQK